MVVGGFEGQIFKPGNGWAASPKAVAPILSYKGLIKSPSRHHMNQRTSLA
jgi:hypothetical protein